MMKKIYESMHGFSKAIMVECKNLLFISGEGPDTFDADIKVQARETFEKLEKRLAESGATFKNVVKMTYFLTDEKDIPGFVEVRSEFIKDEPPTASLIIVKLPKIKLEIEGIAVLQ
ncbi:MAG: RidA family protein [Victivallaceae bacterium]|nr:RidA family protein [Victivallaceae bacterium]